MCDPKETEPSAQTRDADLAGADAAMRRAARRARRRAAAQGVMPATFENGKLVPARPIAERRLLDPVHGFIAFRANDVDHLAWRIVNTPEFQRLRNIKQLGLADMIFPGATHSRFAHSIGAFHTARRLVEAVRREVGSEFDDDRAAVAVLAALLHDVGHGPFSHAFEKAEKGRNSARRHEDWTSEIVSGDTGIRRVLGDYFAEEIAKLFKQKEPVDIYASVVSSQFDADRLDYLQRDRYMTGVKSGAIDYDWLIDNLRVGTITVRQPGDDAADESGEFIESQGFYISDKAFSAAEEYLLARHRLHRQVYLHKTSMGAERMFCALLERIAELTKKNSACATGLPRNHPLLRYYSEDSSLKNYLALDDAAVWEALNYVAGSGSDEDVARLASALRARRLYKCFDVGELAEQAGGDSLPRYKRALRDSGETYLDCQVPLTAYGMHRFDERGAFQKILIERPGSRRPEDILNLSKVLEVVGEKHIYRVYAPDDAARRRLAQIWEEVK